MSRNNRRTDADLPDSRIFDGELRHISAQIRSLGWLISNQPEHAPFPTDLGEAFWGLGTLIEGLGEEVLEISQLLEDSALERHRNRDYSCD